MAIDGREVRSALRSGAVQNAISLSRKRSQPNLKSEQHSPKRAHHRTPSMPTLIVGNYISEWKRRYWTERKLTQQPNVLHRFPQLQKRKKPKRKLLIFPDTPVDAIPASGRSSEKMLSIKQTLASPIEKLGDESEYCLCSGDQTIETLLRCLK